MHTDSRQLAVRSYLTAGVALVGASVIAVSPMAPPLPAVHLPSLTEAGVELAALTGPLAAYGQVFDASVANLQKIFETAAANPTPIVTKVLSNQLTGFQALLASLPTSSDALTTALTNAASADPTSSLSHLLASEPAALKTLVTALQTAFGQISTALTTTVPPLLQGAFSDFTDANVEGAINNVLLAALAPVFPLTTVLGPALGVVAAPLQAVVDAISSIGPVGTVLANPLQNVVNVLNVPSDPLAKFNFLLGAAGLIGPVIEAPAAAGVGIQGVINAIGTGDAAGVLSAVVDVPAVIASGVLQGGVGPDIGDLVAPGLDLPPGVLHAVFGGVLSPPLSGLDDGTLVTSGTLAGLQTLQGLVADALKPPAIPAKTFSLVKADTVSATPSALPSLKFALVGVKTPRALTVKPPTNNIDAQSSSASTATAPDKSTADSTGSNDHSTGTHGRHLASNGDGGGRHARSHESSDGGASGGGQGGSGGGRHRAAA